MPYGLRMSSIWLKLATMNSSESNASSQRGRRANVIGTVTVAAIVVVSLFAIVFTHANAGLGETTSNYVAIVHDGDGGAHELPLTENTEVVISTSRGSNTVVVEDGFVYVREADCENHDCMRQGRLDAPGRQIICLPHQLWIEVIESGSASGQMDVSAAMGNSGGYDAIAR